MIQKRRTIDQFNYPRFFSANIYGSWDGAKQVMTWHGNDEKGNTLMGQHRVTDKDHHEWEMDVMSGEQLLVKLKGKHARPLYPQKIARKD